MRKYLLIFAAALAVCVFSGCTDETTLPYIPVEKPEVEIPSGENPDTYTVNYRLDKVMLCEPKNEAGIDIFSKLNFFAQTRMTLSVSPMETTLEFDNGEIPFFPFEELQAEGPIKCMLDNGTVPTVLRLVEDPKTVLATFEKDGFVISFSIDCKLLTYKYKFKSIN